jgi:hypothetical protein
MQKHEKEESNDDEVREEIRTRLLMNVNVNNLRNVDRGKHW